MQLGFGFMAILYPQQSHSGIFPKFPNVMPVETYFGAVDTIHFGRRKKTFEPRIDYAQYGLSASEIQNYQDAERQWRHLLDGLAPTQARQLLDRLNALPGVMTFSFNLPTVTQGSLSKLLAQEIPFFSRPGSRLLLDKITRRIEREFFGVRDDKTKSYLGAGVTQLSFLSLLLYNEAVDDRGPAVAQTLGNFDMLAHETVHVLHIQRKLMHRMKPISPEAKAYRRIYDAVVLNATRTAETKTPPPDIETTICTACKELSPAALKSCKDSLVSEAVAHRLQAELIRKAAEGAADDARPELQKECDETQRTADGFGQAIRILNTLS